MQITEIAFDLGTGATSKRVLPGDDGLTVIGAHMLNGLDTDRLSVTGPDGGSSTTVTVSTPSGKVLALYLVEQPVSPYATGIPG